MNLEHFTTFLHNVCVGQFDLADEAGVVVAVSGGRDSVALLHGLVTMNQIHQMRLHLVVAHMNHQARGAESDKDSAFVAQLSDQLGVTCVCEVADVAQMANDEHLSLEQIGRRERYRFLVEVAIAHHCRHVAFAHHADDNVETILHRILRGTGLRGLAGIPATRPLNHDPPIRLMRPLLTVRRAQIDELLQANHLRFRDDPSNQQQHFTRNKIRHNLLPMLRQNFNPKVDDSLLRLAKLARGTDDVIIAAARESLSEITVERNDWSIALKASALSQHAPVVQHEIIRQAMIALSIPLQRIGYNHLANATELLEQRGSCHRIDLPGNVTVCKRYDQLLVERRSPTGGHKGRTRVHADEIHVNTNGSTILPGFDSVLHCQGMAAELVAFGDFCRRKSATEEMVDYEKLQFPLCLRSRKSGDRIHPLGSPGSKKVSALLAELKIPSRQRDTTPILCDQQGPIWIIPYRIDQRARVDANTRKLLHFTLTTDLGSPHSKIRHE